jgi:hypothetical protein
MKENPNLEILLRAEKAVADRGYTIFSFCKTFSHNKTSFSSWKSKNGIPDKALSIIKLFRDLCLISGKSLNYFLDGKNENLSPDYSQLLTDFKKLQTQIIEKDAKIAGLTAENNALKSKLNT